MTTNKNIELIKAHLRCINKRSTIILEELPLGNGIFPTRMHDLIAELSDDVSYWIEEITELSSPKD